MVRKKSRSKLYSAIRMFLLSSCIVCLSFGSLEDQKKKTKRKTRANCCSLMSYGCLELTCFFIRRRLVCGNSGGFDQRNWSEMLQTLSGWAGLTYFFSLSPPLCRQNGAVNERNSRTERNVTLKRAITHVYNWITSQPATQTLYEMKTVWLCL